MKDLSSTPRPPSFFFGFHLVGQLPHDVVDTATVPHVFGTAMHIDL